MDATFVDEQTVQDKLIGAVRETCIAGEELRVEPRDLFRFKSDWKHFSSF